MPRRKIKRRSGKGISISGPATVHVSRRVLLIVDAPREARVARLAKDVRPAGPAEHGQRDRTSNR